MRKLICVLGLFASIGCFAQSNIVRSAPQVDSTGLRYQLAALKVLGVFNDVVNNSGLKDELEIYRYKGLFRDEEAEIINHVLPVNRTNDRIMLNDLRSEHIGYTSTSRVFIRAYDLKLVQEKTDEWIYVADVKKEMTIISNEGDEYQDTLDLRYFLAYDLESKEVLIDSVTSNKRSASFITVGYKAGRNNKRLDRCGGIRVNGRLYPTASSDLSLVLKTRKDGFSYVLAPDSRRFLGSLKLGGNKEQLGPNGVLNGRRSHLRIRPKHFFVRSGYHGGAYRDDHVLEESDLDINGSGEFRELNAVLGYTQFFGRWLISLAATFSDQKMVSNYQMDYQFSSYEAVDLDGEVYLHQTELSDIREDVEVAAQYVGGELSLGYELSPIVALQVTYGQQQSVNSTGNYSVDARANYFGYYPQYGLSLYDLPEYGYYTDVVLEDEGMDLALVEQLERQYIGAALSIAMNKRWWLQVNYRSFSQGALFGAHTDAVLSSSRDQSDASVTQLKQGRKWSFPMYGLSLGLYL